MPSFVGDETKVIQAPWWGPDEAATIRRMNYGDRQYLAGQAIRVGITGEDGRREQIGELALGEMNLAIIERGLVSWTDEEGKELPVTRDRIEALDELDGEFILGEIKAFNPRRQRSPENQSKFRDRSGGGDSEPGSATVGS